MEGAMAIKGWLANPSASCRGQYQEYLEKRVSQGTPWGGQKKEGGGKPHEGHPSQKRFWTPLRLVSFPPLSRVSALFSLYKKSTSEQTRSSFGAEEMHGCIT